VFSHRKILRNGRLDVIEHLKEQFNESIYPSTQEQLLQHEIENKLDELLEVGHGSHDLFDSVFLEDGTLRIIENDII
jgi:hypothetical protein